MGVTRKGLTQADVVLPFGTQAVRITDSGGTEVPVQLIPRRRYPDGSITTATILFEAEAPGLGQSVYTCEAISPVPETAQPSGVTVTVDDASLWIENDLYRIQIDTRRGGVISSLYHKQLQREFVDASAERRFNEYRGYFVAEHRWRSSIETPVEVDVIEHGPLRAKVALKGLVGDHPFRTVITLMQGDPKIDVHVAFHFHHDTWIGDPWDIAPDRRRRERRRSHHDDRFKLLATFPTPTKKPVLYKDAPFDVCRSALENTYFKSWDEIKHNIIYRWVDLYDEADDVGLALFSDHTTSYVYGEDHPLALTLGWGWEGGFWWGKRPLRGRQELRYVLIPHAGRWDHAEIPLQINEWSEPLLAFPAPQGPVLRPVEPSLVEIISDGLEVVTLVVDGDDVLVRLFHARDQMGEGVVRLGVEADAVELVELDGRSRSISGARADNDKSDKSDGDSITALRSDDGAALLKFWLPPFALRTLRLRGIARSRV